MLLAYLVVAGMFGGGAATWGLAYGALSLATLLFATLVAWRGGGSGLAQAPAAARIALLGIAILPLVQLVPLPPGLWQSLPGQALRMQTMAVVGLADTWQPMTLEPVSTALVAILAIGFVALVDALLRLTDAQFRRVFQVSFGLVLLGIAIGLLQVVSDGAFPRFHSAKMGATMLGFFANKNHMALAIACSVLLFGLIISGDAIDRRKRLAVVGGYIVFAFVCVVTTNSRAGLALTGLAALIVLATLIKGITLRWRLLAALVTVVAVAAVLSTSAFEQVSGRLDDIDSDNRWRIVQWSWPLAERHGLIGSGLGSYATLFTTHEQLSWVKPTFVNAVHNEYLQLVIETGLPGVVLALALVVSCLPCATALLRAPTRSPRRTEMVAGFAILLLFALHSVVDYPLRRPSAWILFAVGLAAVYRNCRRRWAGSRAAEPDPA